MIITNNTSIKRPVTVLPVMDNNATVLVGNAIGAFVNGISATAANIHDHFDAVTDITDPAGTGGWSTVLSHIDAVPFLVEVAYKTLGEIAIRTDAAETVGRALRIQTLVDNVIVSDGYVIADGASILDFAVQSATGSEIGCCYPIPCNSSYLVRGARVGDFTSAGCAFYMGRTTIRSL